MDPFLLCRKSKPAVWSTGPSVVFTLPVSVPHFPLSAPSRFRFSAPVHPGYFPVFFWSLLILTSFWGYGELLRRRIDRPEFADIGWGLTCAWGMSVVLALGGLLMALHLAKAPVLTVLVLSGAAVAVFYLAEQASTKDTKRTKGHKSNSKSRIHNPKSADSFILHPTAFILYGLALLAFATSIYWPNQIDPNDDWIAYLMYPEKILQTGTFLDPFSLRRVTALGGQSFLQALIMIVGVPENGHILDRGIGAILLLGIMLKVTEDIPKPRWFLRFLVIFAPLAASVPRIHTGSHLLGLAFLLALLATLSRMLENEKWSVRALIPLALILAGASTFRPTFAMVGGGLLVFYFVWYALKADSGKRLEAVRPLLVTGGLTFAFLSPYMFLSWQSSGTPMFPFSPGFANSQMIIGGTKEGGWTNWAAALRFISYPEIAVMSIGLLVAATLKGKTQALAISAALAGFGMVFLSAFKMSAAGAYDVYRYTYPLVGFVLFWILARAAATASGKFRLLAPAAAGVSVVLFFSAHWASAFQNLKMEVDALKIQPEGFHFPVAQLAPAYEKLQDLVPEGEKIFTILDAPYLLDFKRNAIENIDSIGGASPPPTMPFGKGPEALKEYLKGQGFNYVICVDFDNAVLLYTRNLWQNHPRKEWYFKEVWGKFALDFMGNMDALADWGTEARAGNARLIHFNR